MPINKFIFRLKVLTIILIAAGLSDSCASTSSSQTQPIGENKNSANILRIENADNERNKNLTINDVQNNQKESPKAKIKRPYQSKERRKKINFSDDCQYTAGIGDEYLLENTCADAL